MKKRSITAFTTVLMMSFSGTAMAQSDNLLSLPMDDLRSELDRRYDEALAKTKEPQVLAGLNNVYTWATEAKIQCAIAIGYTKSNTRDEDSISKCDRFYQRMLYTPSPTPVTPPLPPAPTASLCNDEVPAAFYFEWDSAVPMAGAAEKVAFINQNRTVCNWRSIDVVGHTDRSGPDSYNYPLSLERANAIADLMRQAGVPDSILTVDGKGEDNPRVETLDGERNPANRRVEIKINR